MHVNASTAMRFKVGHERQLLIGNGLEEMVTVCCCSEATTTTAATIALVRHLRPVNNALAIKARTHFNAHKHPTASTSSKRVRCCRCNSCCLLLEGRLEKYCSLLFFSRKVLIVRTIFVHRCFWSFFLKVFLSCAFVCLCVCLKSSCGFTLRKILSLFACVRDKRRQYKTRKQRHNIKQHCTTEFRVNRLKKDVQSYTHTQTHTNGNTHTHKICTCLKSRIGYRNKNKNFSLWRGIERRDEIENTHTHSDTHERSRESVYQEESNRVC